MTQEKYEIWFDEALISLGSKAQGLMKRCDVAKFRNVDVLHTFSVPHQLVLRKQAVTTLTCGYLPEETLELADLQA